MVKSISLWLSWRHIIKDIFGVYIGTGEEVDELGVSFNEIT